MKYTSTTAKWLASSITFSLATALPSIAARDLSTPVVAGWAFQGCYSDSVAARTLQGGFQAGGSNTIQSCTTYCGSLGFEYAGTEYGVECFCSHSITFPGSKEELGDCDMPCAGDSTQSCGGSNRLTLYKIESASSTPQTTQRTVAPAVGNFEYQGCMTDKVWARSLDTRVDIEGLLTPAKCMQKCAAAGFIYAGVEYSSECYCGASLLNGAAAATSGCDMPCDGDSSHFCGGADRLNVYKQPQQIDNRVWTNFGCWSDKVDARTLSTGIPIDTSQVTIAKCQQECRTRGFTYAGLEYAQECFCGNELKNNAATATYTECNMPCRGNPSEMCGAGDRLSVFKLEAPEEEEEVEDPGYDTDDCYEPPRIPEDDGYDTGVEEDFKKRATRQRRRRGCERKVRK